MDWEAYWSFFSQLWYVIVIVARWIGGMGVGILIWLRWRLKDCIEVCTAGTGAIMGASFDMRNYLTKTLLVTYVHIPLRSPISWYALKMPTKVPLVYPTPFLKCHVPNPKMNNSSWCTTNKINAHRLPTPPLPPQDHFYGPRRPLLPPWPQYIQSRLQQILPLATHPRYMRHTVYAHTIIRHE